MMQRICFLILLLFALSITGNAQGTPGVLRCNLRGGLEIHTSRDPGSSVIGRIQCGDPVLIIDQRFGSPHIRTEDGKDGYVISQNFGQWSLEPESSTATTTATTSVAVAVPPISRTVPTPPQRQEIQIGDESFRRFDIDWVLLSYNRQGQANLYGGNLAFNTNINRRVGIVADVSIHQTVNEFPGLRVTAYRFGPRIYGYRGRRISTFGEILAGGTRVTEEQRVISPGFTTTLTAHVNGFAAAVGGGMDFQIAPWLMWRMYHADFSYLHIPDI